MAPIAGKKWKPEDGQPKREDYVDNVEYEAADTAWRQWRSDQKGKDAAGGQAVDIAQPTGAVTKSKERITGPGGVTVGSRQVTKGNVTYEDPAAKDRAMVEASEAAAAKRAAEANAEPKKPGAGASLGEITAYNKAMQEWKKKKGEEAGGGKKSPYP